MRLRGKPLVISAALIAAALFAAAPALASSKDEAVIAVVNGSKITKKDVMDALQSAPGKKLTDDEMKFIFPRAVEMLVNEKLMDQAVDASKVTSSEAYKKQLAFMEGQMAKQMYLRDYLKEKITDKDVQAAYDRFKKENAGKLEVHAYQIVLPTKIEAEQVIKDLAAGKKFEDLARQRSSDSQSAQNGGDIGYFAKDELPESFKAIGEAAFGLKPGEYTKTPIKSDFGWHVIKITDRRERKIPALETVEGKIRENLSQKAIGDMVADLRKKATLKFFDLDGKPLAAAVLSKEAEKTDKKPDKK